jgi:type IV pilus assembly protein PilY1
MSSTNLRPRRSAQLIAVAFSCSTLLSQQALALTSLSDLPLYALQGVPPNIALTIDDSGSMAWAAVPDSKVVSDAGLRWRSTAYNALYYNPGVRYVAPPDENGVARTTSFTAAWINGFDPTRGSVNLSNNYKATREYNPNNTTQTLQNAPTDSLADYGVLNLNNAACDKTSRDTFGAYLDNDCYTRVIVSATSGPATVDINGDGLINATDKDERQNFANWYSFYRTRNLATVSAATLAFGKLDSAFRIGYQNLHTCDGFTNASNGCEDRTGTDYDSRLSVFSGTARTNFFRWLQRSPASGGTPLLPALQRTGEMFKTDRAWQNTIGDNASGKHVCRGNYAVLMTDGIWNTSWAAGMSDADNASKTLPDGAAYTAGAPYKKTDGSSHSLADIAFHYWSQDLRTDLNSSEALKYMPVKGDEKVDGTSTSTTLPPYWNPKNDPANWQHMVTYTIGLGLTGNLGADWQGNMYKGAYGNFVTGAKTWPATGFDSIPGNVYDLWHAAINGRGGFYSAESPNDVVQAFQDIVSSISERQGSAVAASLNSSRIAAGTFVYAAGFNTGDWSGKLRAHPIADGNGGGCSGVAGTVCSTPRWAAETLINDQTWAGRTIITNSGGPKAFRWSALSAVHQTALNDSDGLGERRLEYLRGSRALESGGTFRERSSVLGDIINSSPAPLYVGAPSFFLPNEAGYADFKEKYKGRQPMVYVGANDGMLHGFDALTGVEKVAFVPNAVYPNLSKLTKVDYKHQPYVDGGMIGYDIKVDGAWRTYLFGGLGLGGKAVYALDVTDPSTFSEGRPADFFKWEFTDPGLGVLNAKPKVARLNNGRTAVVFGSGYLDGTTAPSLYILDVKDGSIIRRIPIPTTDGGATTFSDNGLAGVTLADEDFNGTTDSVYAGDLYGNLWKFDLTSSSTATWNIAYTGGSGGLPMFVAKTSTGVRQPITTEPALAAHPSGNGLIVYFGTGKYLGASDISTTQVQTMYAVWNRKSHNTGLTRSHLLQQKILADDTSTFGARDARVTTDLAIKWSEVPGLPPTGSHMGWYIDFSTESGERVHQAPFLRDNRIVFVTVTPSTDPCSAGGTSWLYELNGMSGSRLTMSPFDYNGDNSIGSLDYAVVGGKSMPGSAIRNEATGVSYLDKESVVRMPNPGPGAPCEGKIVSTSGGSLETVKESCTGSQARHWRELINR